MRFIKNFPALFIQEIKTLVIADLHIGFSYELYKSGVRIPSQANNMKRSIKKLIKKTNAKRLIINGDLKHEVPGMSYQEMKEIPEFLKDISEIIRVDLIKGNHDTLLEKLPVKEIHLHGAKGFKIGRFGFIHGHAWPSKKLLTCDYLILGHAHPVVQFKDKFGYRILEQVWVKGKIDKEKIKERYKLKKIGRLEVIIMPAFNRLLGGTVINDKKVSDELLGPLLKNEFVDIRNAQVYLLDGTYLGKLKNLTRN